MVNNRTTHSWPENLFEGIFFNMRHVFWVESQQINKTAEWHNIMTETWKTDTIDVSGYKHMQCFLQNMTWDSQVSTYDDIL